MAKQVVGQAKFQVPGGAATPAPPVGTSLGKFGINLGQFVSAFNERTREYNGTPIPVVVTVYSDRTFEFVTKSPPAAALLKQAAGIASGSGEPNKKKVGKVTQAQIDDICQKKMADLNARDLEHAAPQSKDPLPLAEAISILKSFPARKFDQSVEIHMHLGIDPAQADQIVRGSVVLPHGIGKTQRVVVFAKGDLAAAAEQAGAEVVGQEDLAKRIKDGWTDFDVCVATPDMMGLVGPLGKVLGPRGLMPSPRAGTVTMDVARVIAEYKAGKVEFRNDKGSNLHAIVGKLSFEADKLSENVQAFLQFVNGLKPQAVKGTYVKSIALCATMSPSVRVSA